MSLAAALDLVHALARRGVSLRLDDGGNGIRVRGKLTESDRAAIAAVRPDLVELLDRQRRALEDIQKLPADRTRGCRDRVTLELPGGGRVRVVPARADGTPDQDRYGVMHVTWADLAADPAGTLATVTAVAGAAAMMGGYVRYGRDQSLRPDWMSEAYVKAT